MEKTPFLHSSPPNFPNFPFFSPSFSPYSLLPPVGVTAATFPSSSPATTAAPPCGRPSGTHSGGFHPKTPWLIGRGGTLGSAGVGVVGFCPQNPHFCWVLGSFVGSVGFYPKMVIFGWVWVGFCGFRWVSPQNPMSYGVGWDFGVCGCWGRWVLPPKSPFLLGFVGILGSENWPSGQPVGHNWPG